LQAGLAVAGAYYATHVMLSEYQLMPALEGVHSAAFARARVDAALAWYPLDTHMRRTEEKVLRIIEEQRR
jgi:hypothetical protein